MDDNKVFWRQKDTVDDRNYFFICLFLTGNGHKN